MSTGMPAGIWLTKFGVIVRDYFGHVPYHVGSSLDRKDWRDVDVRLIMPDDEFAARFGDIRSSETNPKLAAITLAFATLGQQMTGLPIDFQIQPQTWANEHYSGPRSALLELRTEEASSDRPETDVWMCGAFQPARPPRRAYRCTRPYDHDGPHRAEMDGEVLAEWPRPS